jgi:hypothetical protein
MATAPRITLLATILACMAGPAHGSGACSVSGSASAPSDVTRARAACDTAQRRFSELFGTQAPAALVVLHDRPAYELALAGDVGIVFWPNGAALAAGVGGGEGKDGRADAHWREVLPHELMHAMTMAHFFAHGNVANHGGYGTPLPDWFEEGVAIWGETMESRRARLEQARLLPAARRDLYAILGGAHPAAGNAMLMAPIPGADLPPDDALRAFYPQAIAVVAFVFESGGPPAMAELGKRLRQDPRATHPLVNLPGLPDTAEELLRAWADWMAEEAP